MRSRQAFAVLGLLVAAAAFAAQPAADFAGTWKFVPAKSRNLGMMAALEVRAAVEQTATQLSLHEKSTFQGQQSSREVTYDLTGKPVTNPTPMGEKSETVARWEGQRLVTTWTHEGSVAGSRVVRTETRSLSPDGKTMTVESARAGAEPVVMVYERVERPE